MALTFITWFWGHKYPAEDIIKLATGLKRNSNQQFRFVVFSQHDLQFGHYDFIEVAKLTDEKLIGQGCFCRLRMFDPTWQAWHGFNDRIVSVDLDLIVTDNIDALFNSNEPFKILQHVNAVNPNPFNCSLMLLRAGQCSEVWTDFNLEKVKTIPFHEFPDDQGWIWHKLPKAKGWNGGVASGIYAFQKPGWPRGNHLPHNAKMVAFIGWRKPVQFKHLDWVNQNWRVGL